MAAELNVIDDISPVMSDSALGSIEGIDNESQENYFFEGAEKLLEVWFRNGEDSMKNEAKFDLREILTEEIWSTKILPEVKCEIMSSMKDADQTAYVLSESSLFVTKNKYILKTCGQTKCLSSLPLVLDIIKKEKDSTKCQIEIDQVFYSRKNFSKPEQQPEIYASNNFEREREFLDDVLADKCNNQSPCKSKSFCLGELSANKWFLYQAKAQPSGIRSNNAEKAENSNAENSMMINKKSIEPDQTLEILMLNLDPSTMKSNFFGQQHVTKELKLDQIISNTVQHDEHIFQPCGYSSNSLISKANNDNNDNENNSPGLYTTIHVTPEDLFSYASFETNAGLDSKNDTTKIIDKILDIFRPTEYILTIVATKNSKCYPFVRQMIENDDDVQFCSLGDYGVMYKHFVKE